MAGEALNEEDSSDSDEANLVPETGPCSGDGANWPQQALKIKLGQGSSLSFQLLIIQVEFQNATYLPTFPHGGDETPTQERI